VFNARGDRLQTSCSEAGVRTVHKILIALALATIVGACNTPQEDPPVAAAAQPDANTADLRFPFEAEAVLARGHSAKTPQ
jgi:hypothetical protein